MVIERVLSGAPQRVWPDQALRGLAACTMPASPEAVPALRRFSRAVARRWRLADHFDEALAVIVTELVTNAVLHSGSPWVSLSIDVRGGSLTVEVLDGGSWKERTAPRREPLDDRATCGRGLHLVEAYATRTVVRRVEPGTAVTAVLALHRVPEQSGPVDALPSESWSRYLDLDVLV
ncbi:MULTISPECIES: ATP-binding protein [Streptomyces]|uniref:ATP-binding protein n=1 Tax=Streptomyces sudanensis TaxID=436397 RepID=A0ABY4TCY2_9ACTN|nr:MULTISPECIES: ATP-binding protein [Streptomyces]MCP9956237.1 ATP-binding protein [Streptomyces sudanensis]MCP9985448.1 ATP-binding protein [Streptomyces sudanensis]MCQ0003130.1 ATP-binding protein [Streptomyces sudanensis]URN14672.1 ATP-binding protein [Streptomyces sudanensis]